MMFWEISGTPAKAAIAILAVVYDLPRCKQVSNDTLDNNGPPLSRFELSITLKNSVAMETDSKNKF